MNVDKTIEITVQPDGQTIVETKGFTGSSCRDASKFIEQAMGNTVSEHLTAEFHELSLSEQRARNQL